MTDVTIEHPAWCVRTECTTTATGSGTHFSPTATLEPDPLGRVRATVRMTQSEASDLVELMLTYPLGDPENDDTEEYIYVLTGDRAHALGRMLVSAGRQAMSP
jgi:hypothetical protein